MVYFIKCKEFVKIGYAKKVENRLSNLKCDNPFEVELINTMDGWANEELDCHYYFKDLHHRGDWFHFSEEMYSIKEIPKSPLRNKKIKTHIDQEQIEEVISKLIEEKKFIHSGCTTNEIWRALDKKKIKEHNKNLTGCSTASVYFNILRHKDTLTAGYKSKIIKEKTGLESSIICRYKKILKQKNEYWKNIHS